MPPEWVPSSVHNAAEENGSELRWGSGHGYGRGKWLKASLGGGGECEVVIWLTPSPAYIEPPWAAERSFLRLFATPSEFGPFGFPVVPKNVKLHNKNYYDEFNYRY